MKKEKKNQIVPIIASIFLLVFFVGLDQWTKWAIDNSMKPQEVIEIIPGLFNLHYVFNEGAGFSMLEGVGMPFFVILTIVCLGFMVYYFYEAKDLRIQLSLAVIAAGAIGNMLDRMLLGHVRDFFSVYIFGWPFPIFNVADICITVGFVLLIISFLLEERKNKRAAKQ